MNTVKIHTVKNAKWQNAAGDEVPVKFVPKADKVKEGIAGNIYKAAIRAEATLLALHCMMRAAFTEVDALLKEEYEMKSGKKKTNTKGNLVWYNFDKSLKVEANINDIVKWDDALMTEALSLLNDYISSNMSDANELINQLVQSAFANTKGMIDTGKVFQILRYESKIKHKQFQKACELIKQAQSVDKTKLYMRVWEKDSGNEYRNINLNFSNI